MRPALFSLLIVLICSACGSGLQLPKRMVKPITPSYSALVNSGPFYVVKNRYGAQTLLRLFEIWDTAQSNISVSFNSNSELLLTYMTQGKTKTVTFKGKFKRRGYYEVVLRKKRTEIPPFVPILYSRVDVKRLRLALNPSNDLVVDDKWQRTGNVFFLAGGASGRTQSFFETRDSVRE